MTDTPDHIKALQLKIWLSKTPEQRLFQFLTDNEAFFLACKKAKEVKAAEIKNTVESKNLD